MGNGLTVEDIKKDLQGLVAKEKALKEKEKETSLPEAEKKALEERRKKEQEEKALKDAEVKRNTEILAKKPEELSDEEKPIRAKLDEEKRKEEEAKLSADEKLKRIEEKSQRRIDEVMNELKQLKDKGSKEGQELQAELKILRQENESLKEKLTKPKEEKEDPAALLKVKENERISKYLEEDKSKPREQRREMTKEELSDWALEDLEAATVWITKRTNRREREYYSDGKKYQKDIDTKDFLERQSESDLRLKAKYPELDTTKREEELKAEGKSNKEIFNILRQENEMYRLASEIVSANPDKYYSTPKGPELLADEIEKRLKTKPTEKSDLEKTVEAMQKKLEEQEALIASLQNSDTGINSTVPRKKEESGKLTEQEETLVQTLKELKTPQDRIDSALKKFREKKGK